MLGDRLRAAPHQAPGQEAPERPLPVAPLVLEVHAGVVRGGREVVEGAVRRQLAGERRHDAAHVRLAVTEVLLEGDDAVLRARLDEELPDLARVLEEPASVLLAGDRSQRANGEPRGRPSGQLRGAEDRGVVRDVVEERAVGGAAVRPAPDPAAVEELVPPAREAEVEHAGVLHEERTPLLEERLERRQVDDGRVRLDLAEVRVDGGVERERRTEPVAQVDADAGVRGRAVEERVARLGRAVVQAAHRVGEHLEASRAVRGLDALERPELAHRRPAAAVRSRE